MAGNEAEHTEERMGYRQFGTWVEPREGKRLAAMLRRCHRGRLALLVAICGVCGQRRGQLKEPAESRPSSCR